MAATLETFTMAPPVPPVVGVMRRTASRAHTKLPSTLTDHCRCRRSTLMASTRQATSTHASVVHQPAQRPQLRIHLREHAQHVRLQRHVALHGHGAATLDADGAHHLVNRQ